jgi:hypothetical protein
MSSRMLLVVLIALAFAPGCRSCTANRASGRASPVCAVQDCATGNIIDDGCAADGRCLSCVTPCPNTPVPSNQK